MTKVLVFVSLKISFTNSDSRILSLVISKKISAFNRFTNPCFLVESESARYKHLPRSGTVILREYLPNVNFCLSVSLSWILML